MQNEKNLCTPGFPGLFYTGKSKKYMPLEPRGWEPSTLIAAQCGLLECFPAFF